MSAELNTRMTRDEFKALARAKGWKFTMLAQRWGVTPEWISSISRDAQRDLCYDDALFGLPDLNRVPAELRSRRRTLTNAAQGARQSAPGRRTRKKGPGYRYQGYVRLGSILTVAAAFGSIAQEGERGIVVEVADAAGEENYRVIFENGASETFSPDAVDTYLADTGLLASGCDAYRYVDPHRLLRDFEAGRFRFWSSP